MSWPEPVPGESAFGVGFFVDEADLDAVSLRELIISVERVGHARRKLSTLHGDDIVREVVISPSYFSHCDARTVRST